MAIARSKLGHNNYRFDDSEIIGSGRSKNVYFCDDNDNVIALYKDLDNLQNKYDRLESIVTNYRDDIFNDVGSHIWEELFCWPHDIVEYENQLGMVLRKYNENFYFNYGTIENDFYEWKGTEKKGSAFTSSKLFNNVLDPNEKGDWFNYFKISINLSRSVRRMHAAGLAHSDLSYNNVLIDPLSGMSCIIDVDELVVPNKYPPEVIGTPDFIAPEIFKTKHLDESDNKFEKPNRYTDLHALAVLIYMYLFKRHPLRGTKCLHEDPATDEELIMGSEALFIEDPYNIQNRPDISELDDDTLPFSDPSIYPFENSGPFLTELFKQSFVYGLHEKSKRPTANEWEEAILNTSNLFVKCSNMSCNHKWFIWNNEKPLRCSFCRNQIENELPILDLYIRNKSGNGVMDNLIIGQEKIQKKIVCDDYKYLFKWDVYTNYYNDEKNTDKNPVAYCSYYLNNWVLVNQSLKNMKDLNEDKIIPIGEYLVLEDDKRIMFDTSVNGRIAFVRIANK